VANRKGQTMIYKLLHRKRKIGQHQPHKNKSYDELRCNLEQ